jgi:hypothetical protein
MDQRTRRARVARNDIPELATLLAMAHSDEIVTRALRDNGVY